MICPDTLRKGDKIAVISPASIVKPEFIDGACGFIRSYGYEPVVMPHAKGPASGNYASAMQSRLDDLLAAWTDSSVKAVLCSRGGYGAVHLLPHIPGELFRLNPKWLIGFSDISALHALSLSQGVMSIHGPMARDFVKGKEDGEAVMDIISSGVFPDLIIEKGEYADESIAKNICGSCKGRLVGGNLAVLEGLAATPFDMMERALKEDCILFIEDIGEPIYKTERMLYRLYMQGVLSRVKGLIVGQFTESRPDANHKNPIEMISRFFQDNLRVNYPVIYNFPVGHVERNIPLITGSMAELTVAPEKSILHLAKS